MSRVLDSSVTLAWLYSDELTPATQQVFDRVADGAWVLSLWHLEVADSLQGEVRRGHSALNFVMLPPTKRYKAAPNAAR